MRKVVMFIFSIILCIDIINTYKILGVFPVAAPSHYILENALMKGLAEAGHNVTTLTCFKEKHPPSKGQYRQIILKEAYEAQMGPFKEYLKLTTNKGEKILLLESIRNLLLFNNMGYLLSQFVLNNTEVQKFIKSKEKFDIVIIPQNLVEAPKALATYFGSHLVLFSTTNANSWIDHFVGNSKLPSLYPEMKLGLTGDMNFSDRLTNTIFRLISYCNQNILHNPSQAKLVHKYISKDIDLYKTQYNVSLVLSNGHVNLNPAGTAVPCIKDIAGFHVKVPKKLPHHLQKFLDNAKDGVIYFSLGSNLKSTFLPIETTAMIMKVFSKRKEQILWKFEDNNLPGKPKNVKIEKWLPQSDLLAHPNIKLFITHGGFLSTIETVYHGVPTIAIPMFSDQKHNARVAEIIGFTKMLDFASLTEKTLSDAIEEVLTNKKYLQSAKDRSKIFHDRPLKPMEEAIYWLEYIVRHNGADHLKVGYLDLYWYQYYMLDIFGIIFAVIYAIYFVITRIFRWILSKVCKQSVRETNKIKNQ